MHRRRGILLIRLGLGLAVLLLAWRLLHGLGWSELWQRATSSRSGCLWLAGLCLAARGFLMGARWLQCLPLLGQSFSRSYVLAAQLAGIAVNHLTPTARLLGGVVRARYLNKRYPVSFADAYGTVLVDQTSHQLLQGLLTWLALASLSWALGAQAVAISLVAVPLLGINVLLLWLRRRRALADRPLLRLARRWIEKRARRLGPVLKGGRRVADILCRSIADVSLQVRLALLGVAILATSTTAQWLVFRSLDIEVGILTVVVVVTVGVAAGVATGTPGGIATTEAAMITAFVSWGVPEVEAATGTLLYRALHYLVVLTIGLPALIYCEMSDERAVRSEDSPVSARDPNDVSPGHESSTDSTG